MRNCTAIAVLVIGFVARLSFAQGAPAGSLFDERGRAAWELLADCCEQAREIECGLRDAPNQSDAAHAAQLKLAGLAAKARLGADVFTFAALRAAAREDAESLAQARKAAALCGENPILWADACAFIGGIAVSRNDIPSRRCTEDALACVFPVSLYTWFSDSAASRQLGRVDRGVIPAIDDKKLLRIANVYAAMNMPQRALQAYVEAWFATGVPQPRVGAPSAKLSGTCLKTARAAIAAGDEKIFATCVAEAVIFGNDAQATEGRNLIRAVADGKFAPTTAPAAPDPEALLEIARLYVEMNVHPRALALLREHEELLGGEGRALAERWTEDWRKRVERFCALKENCTLFGQKIAETDVAHMRIPWPCEPEQVKQAVAKLREAPMFKE